MCCLWDEFDVLLLPEPEPCLLTFLFQVVSFYSCRSSFAFIVLLPPPFLLSFLLPSPSSFFLPAHILSLSYFLRQSLFITCIWSFQYRKPLHVCVCSLLPSTHGALFPYVFSYGWLQAVNLPYNFICMTSSRSGMKVGSSQKGFTWLLLDA